MKLFTLTKSTSSLCIVASLVIIGSIFYSKRFDSANQLDGDRFHEIENQGNSPHYRNTFDSGLSQSIESVRYQEVVAATQNFLSLLDEKQRAAVVLNFDNPYRTRAFCYVLAQCKDDNVGLRMSQLNTKQKIALNNVLMKSYSSAGYSRAIQTMNREGLIEEMENAHRANPEKYRVIGSPQVSDWTPPPYRKGSDFYVAIFGKPAVASVPLLAKPWGIRFEGHHLSLNLTFDGQRLQPQVNATPMFFGSSPTIVPQSPTPEEGEYNLWQTQEGQQLLHREAWLARSFLQSLEEKEIARGAWSALPHAELKGGTDAPLDAASYLENEKPGIEVAELNPLQQRLLWDFVKEFWQMQADRRVGEEALKRSLGESRVWYFGDRNDEYGELYVRVQSDRYLIEFLQSNTFGVISGDVEANHVHASFRDLKHDWDYNSLGDHLDRHHLSSQTP